MKTFRVWFEIYGKKMVTTIQADTEAEAKVAIRQKIRFIKIEIDEGNIPDYFKDIFK